MLIILAFKNSYVINVRLCILLKHLLIRFLKTLKDFVWNYEEFYHFRTPILRIVNTNAKGITLTTYFNA